MPDDKDGTGRTEPQSQQSIAVLGVVIAAVLSILTGEGYFTPFSIVLGGALILVLLAFDTRENERVNETRLRSIAFSMALALSVMICVGVVANLLYILPALLIQNGVVPVTLTREDTSYWVFFFGDLLFGTFVVAVAVFVYLHRRCKIDTSEGATRDHPLWEQARGELRYFRDLLN